ncbi:MAG: SEC-C domain-containing protein [Candidatus Krumholzibacteria bacterium]|nr:SEC-C domain-containing protein [Candidatus Krumholzibacteria bacterium]
MVNRESDHDNRGKTEEQQVAFLSILKKLVGGGEAPPQSAKNLSRNAPCWCGSGSKYKQCHYEKDRGFFTAKQNESCKGPT